MQDVLFDPSSLPLSLILTLRMGTVALCEAKDDIWECLRRDDGVQGNAVKVAYMLLRDKNRLGKDLAEFAEAERDAQEAAMDPRNTTLSPTAMSPAGTDLVETNPFEAEFNAEYDEADDELVDEEDLDFYAPPPEQEQPVNAAATFAVLNSSLPEQLPEQHHLTSYVSAKRSGRSNEKKQHRTKWHFGIRSRSPPMEVMLEIYRTLKTLGMEWKEKKNLGGLGGLSMKGRRDPFQSGDRGRPSIERAKEFDGDGGVDLKAAAGIYFVETRCRVQDVVVLMNLQLYMVDSINYLVDFHHKKSYKASTEPGAGKYDMANFEVLPDSSSDSSRSLKEKDGSLVVREDEVVSPYVFMDVACRLILELAGGGE
ncbi:hypothetical protein NMY22_g10467 [Coprinellus aureogranulatus]|nr:hypothetical protein NMY22_g10467 [Coprinellus aureogranulatus]